VSKTPGGGKATTDERQIATWWRRWPKAMIGLPMGENGLFALDFDPCREEIVDPDTGEVTGVREWTLEQLKADTEAQIGCELPVSLAVRTPSGGVHVYYRQPGDGGAPLRNRGVLPEHVDTRGQGGYVIAPPSIIVAPCASATAGEYRFLRGNRHAEAVEPPAELVAVLRAPKAKAPPAAGGTPAADNKAAADQAASSSPSPPRQSVAGDDPGEAAKRRYALSALERECDTLSQTPHGNRNNQANASGFVMGQLVGAGALGESFARAALYAAVSRFNDPPKAQTAIDNGLTAGLAEPRDLGEIAANARQRAERWSPARSASGAAPSPRPSPPAPSRRVEGLQSSRSGSGAGNSGRKGPGGVQDADLERRCAFCPQTDLGNLERFLARHGDDFLFVEAWGWLAWDGRRWNRDMAVPLLGRAVQRTMRAIQGEAKLVRDSGMKDDDPGGLDFVADTRGGKVKLYSDMIAAWGRTSESSGHIGCIAKLAEARLAARTEDFDQAALMLNVLNGTIDFHRPEDGRAAWFEKREHRRGDLMTKIANAEFDPEAACPLFDGFLEEVQPDPEMRDFLYVWSGYNALGLADAQKFALFYGEGSNGKGVWVSTHAHILGDYAWAAAIETFIDQGKYRKGSDASPDLAALAGRRMVFANEPEENSKFSDGLIKELTSDDPKGGVRELMKPPFTLQITFTNTISANNLPKIGTDHGIKRRVQVVPWGVIISDARADPLLKTKLRDEANGILNHMIRGALQYLTSGIPSPEAIKEATQHYHEENDILGRFIDKVVVKVPGEKVGAAEFHGAFAAWQTWSQLLPATGKPWSAKHLNSQMQKKGFKISKSSSMQWHDIALLYTRDAFVDEHGNARNGELPPPLRLAGADDGAPRPEPPAPSGYGDDDDLPVF
jgi:putative DNA primase/helicase